MIISLPRLLLLKKRSKKERFYQIGLIQKII